MNIILGLLLSTLAFMIGVPTIAENADPASIKNPRVLIAEVLLKSPAAAAGLKVGDEIASISAHGAEVEIKKPEDVLTAIENAEGPLTMHVLRNKITMDFTAVPVKGLDRENPDRAVIGIAPALVGIRSFPLLPAFIEGVSNTVEQTKAIVMGLGTLIGEALTFSADLSTVAGPVGIVSLVGDASGFGVGSILALAALISINLGVVNLLPFPALDGGRLALLAAETVSRRKIPAGISNFINIAGFGILILLMLAVTAHDIFRLMH
jgi:regulator of sigma E protease